MSRHNFAVVCICAGLLAAPAFAHARGKHAALTSNQQLAKKNALIADLRDQVHYLTGEVEALRARLPLGSTDNLMQRGTATGTSTMQPANQTTLSYSDQETILQNEIDGARPQSERFILVHGYPVDGGGTNEENVYMKNILKWDAELIVVLNKDIASDPDAVKRSFKQVLLGRSTLPSDITESQTFHVGATWK